MGLSNILEIQNNRMIKQLIPDNLQNVSQQLTKVSSDIENNSIRLLYNEDSIRNLAKIAENVTPDVSVASYNPVNTLSTNARDSAMSLKLKGRTLKNELVYNRDTWAEWTKSSGVIGDNTGLEFTQSTAFETIELLSSFKSSTKYGILYNVLLSTLVSETLYIGGGTGYAFTPSTSEKTAGNKKFIATTASSITSNKLRIALSGTISTNKIKIKDIRIFELPTGSEIESDFTTMAADQLALKYPYINGQRDVKGGRTKQTGKNLINNKSNDIVYDCRLDQSTGLEFKPSSGNFTTSYIRILPSANYYISNANASSTRYVLYDINKNFISGILMQNTSILISTPNNAQYIRLSNLTSLINSGLQLELGNVVTPSQPYVESLTYVPDVGKSLPNGLRDEINVVSGNKVQNIKEYTLLASDITSMNTICTNLDFAVVKKSTDSIGYNNISNMGYSVLDGYTEFTSDLDNTSNIGMYRTNYNASSYYVGFTKGTTLEQAQTSLTGRKVRYQLKTPIVTLLLPQAVKSSASGTITWEYIKGEADIYTTSISISDTTLPIKSIVRLYKVNKENGIETPLTISQAVISSDKLSFTHPSLVNGDLVDWDYEYDSALSVNPRFEYGYSNNLFKLETTITPTFLNSWLADTSTVGYYRNSFGEVELIGSIKSGTLGLTAFTMPTGYRPTIQRKFVCVSNNAFGYVVVNTDGTVVPYGSNVSISLDGISFRTD